jgi:hypothetical protein
MIRSLFANFDSSFADPSQEMIKGFGFSIRERYLTLECLFERTIEGDPKERGELA